MGHTLWGKGELVSGELKGGLVGVESNGGVHGWLWWIKHPIFKTKLGGGKEKKTKKDKGKEGQERRGKEDQSFSHLQPVLRLTAHRGYGFWDFFLSGERTN